MTAADRKIETVRRRLIESTYAEGVNMLHARTHLHRKLIADLVHLVADRPDPPMVILGLYDAWGGGVGDYEDFVTYAHRRIRG